MKKCKFCERECAPHGLHVHENRCKMNPNPGKHSLSGKTGKSANNQYIKAKREGYEYIVSEDSRKNFSKAASERNRNSSPERRQKFSEAAKKRGLGGITQSRRITYNGKSLGSSYELKLVKDLDLNEVKWETCKKFNYIDKNGKERSYTPDIFLPEYDTYLDPKNDFLINNVNPGLGFTDQEKIERVQEQNNIKVFILNKDQLNWEYVKTLV